jgi:hypothetical protein
MIRTQYVTALTTKKIREPAYETEGLDNKLKTTWLTYTLYISSTASIPPRDCSSNKNRYASLIETRKFEGQEGQGKWKISK